MDGIRQHRPLMAVAALFALLLRIAVPQGTMLSPAGGGVVMTLCSGVAGMAGQVIVHDGKPKPAPATGDQPCAFAALGAPMLAGDVPPPVVPPLLFQVVPPAMAVGLVMIGRGLAAPPPPATGPPVRV